MSKALLRKLPSQAEEFDEKSRLGPAQEGGVAARRSGETGGFYK